MNTDERREANPLVNLVTVRSLLESGNEALAWETWNLIWSYKQAELEARIPWYAQYMEDNR